MKKLMMVVAMAAALASCGTGSKKNSEATVVNEPVIVEAGTHEPDSVGYIVRVGDIAPELEMELTDGQKVKLSSLRGKVVMLQFTASWCGVCRKEMPFIEKDIWQYIKIILIKQSGLTYSRHNNISHLTIPLQASCSTMTLSYCRTFRHHHISERLSNNIASTNDSHILTIKFNVIVLAQVDDAGGSAWLEAILTRTQTTDVDGS